MYKFVSYFQRTYYMKEGVASCTRDCALALTGAPLRIYAPLTRGSVAGLYAKMRV